MTYPGLVVMWTLYNCEPRGATVAEIGAEFVAGGVGEDPQEALEECLRAELIRSVGDFGWGDVWRLAPAGHELFRAIFAATKVASVEGRATVALPVAGGAG